MGKHRKTMSMFVTPDLTQIQIESFCNLLLNILPLDLSNLEKIQYKNIQFQFKILGSKYRFELPKISEQKAIYQGATYSSNLYVPVFLYNQDERYTEMLTVMLGTLPLMTINGAFIINGISRCIVSQLTRSPGIYYTLNSDKNYIATIISNSGKRLKLKLNSEDAVWVVLHNNATIPLVTLLLAFGLDLQYIPSKLIDPTYFINNHEEAFPISVEDALKYVSNIVKPNITKLKSGYTFSNIFLNDYALGSIGRFNFNQRLGLNLLDNDKSLRVEDILVAALHLFQFDDGNEYVDDIDDLKYKQVKRIAETIQEQMRNSFSMLNKKILNTLNKRAITKRALSASYFFYIPPISLERFFTSYELSQFLDQTNPLADIVHKRKLSALGPGGLTPRTARFRVRDIHPSQYGRICPIETAEGEKAGIVTSLTTSAQIDKQGRLENLVYSISSLSMKGTIKYIIANNDEYTRISTGRCLEFFKQGFNITFTPVQHRREFANMSWDEINFRSLVPLHFFSVGVGLIPFLEHDDSTRALMGSNMQRQAVTLLRPERPIVGTGMEAHIGFDSNTILKSNETGYVEYVDNKSIVLRIINSHILYKINLVNYSRLNNNICFWQKPIVYAKQYIRKGQLIADSNATVGGELALGKNVLVAYMPWEGYNFEDAILISERLVSENIYTSFHIERYDTELRITNDFSESLTKDIPHLPKYVLRHLDSQGVVQLGNWVEPGDVLVGKLIINQSDVALYGPESRLLQEIFGIDAITTQENCLKVPLRGAGRVIDVRSFYSENGTFGRVHTIQVYILQKRSIQVGDKLAGRHGNKGVVSKILPREDMPYLPNGTSVDMVLSPLGVPSRMNVGQVFEALLGWSGALLEKNYRILPFDERYEKDASRKLIFSELYKASKYSKYPWVFEASTPGKMHLFDGRTGEIFDQTVSVGKAYIFKLVHQVDDKIHARSTGPYAIVTQQPLRGKSRQGGQRVGEMEVWAFQGFGAAYALQELLTTKSDHIQARSKAIKAIMNAQSVPFLGSSSDCLRAFMRELWSLGITINQTSVSEYNGTESIKQI
jgi:DNA-directed RNA polymerase subunit beta